MVNVIDEMKLIRKLITVTLVGLSTLLKIFAITKFNVKHAH